MIYKEEYIATAHTVQELINILKDKVPADADVDVGNMATTVRSGMMTVLIM